MLRYNNLTTALYDKRQLRTNGKTLNVLMDNYTQEERLDKFMEFLNVFDLRQDPIIRDNFQQFSHRLHWDEHPFCKVIQDLDNDMERIWFTLLFSFSNEYWRIFDIIVNEGEEALKEHLSKPKNRVMRTDLFNIYFPKGVKVRDWIINDTKKAAISLQKVFENRKKPFTMMQFAYKLRSYFKTQNFKNCLYPCKNAARYMAMAMPSYVNPNTYIHPGTGSFRGLHQIFGGEFLMSKAKFELNEHTNDYEPLNIYADQLLQQFEIIKTHSKSPIIRHHNINIEDKACFFFKHITMYVGIQKATKQIPYEYVFPNSFSLEKKGE
tara:strand:- start:1096 stop:2061 length:966 start_codon:yes stop_codon:yes gene_type:complete